MRAIVARGPLDWSVEEVPEPPCPPGGAVVEVEAAGVCAADRMLWTGEHPWGALAWPFTPGHELLGTVVDTERADVVIGDRVSVEVMVPCDACATCRRGRENLCRLGAHVGSNLPGAFADRLALPARARLHRVPHHLPVEQAVLAEPMACAVHAVRRCDPRPGETLAVAGIGAIGACALVAAPVRTLALVRSPAKAERAQALGAEPVAALEPDSVDVFLDCSGDPAAVVAGLGAVRPGGRAVLYGVYRRPAPLDLNLIAEFKELDVRGGHLAPGAFPAGIALLPRAAGIVTDMHPLEAFRTALEPAPGRLKAVLVP